ncbi:MAG: damage-control phosphatase ARMT1 family protein [Planctomycetota bacterium]
MDTLSYLDCYPCIIRRATEALKHSGLDEKTQFKVMSRVMGVLSSMDGPENGSSEMIRAVFKVIREKGGVHDPMENVKSYCVDVALRAYPELKHTVEVSEDRFATAVRIAMAGNIIDHSPEEMRDNLALFRNIEDALSRPLSVNHIDALKEEIQQAGKILYLADNAGETVFDRILIEEMPSDRIVYGVKGQPVSNDATRRDAEMAGLTRIVEVVEDGTDSPALRPDNCSPEFKRIFDSADLIISKGQGNLKALEDTDRNIFFLARVRCRVTAYQYRLSVGDFLVMGRKVKD